MEIIQLITLASVFAMLAILVRQCRITSIIILLNTLVNLLLLDALNGLSAQGAATPFLIIGCFDMLAAFAIIMFGDAKKFIQAFILTLFVTCHSLLGIEVTIKYYVIYDYYEYLILILNITQILVMGGYYRDLIRNTKQLFTDIHSTGFSLPDISRALVRALDR